MIRMFPVGIAVVMACTLAVAQQNATSDSKGTSAAKDTKVTDQANVADQAKADQAKKDSSAAKGTVAPEANTAQGSSAPENLTQPPKGEPETKYLDKSAANPMASGQRDPLLNPPPVPGTPATLVGGTVERVDRVRNRMTVRPFEGKQMKVYFDERTHVFLNGVETTIAKVTKGQRVYVDTQLDGPHVFARNIRMLTESGPADARGQLVSVDRGRITVRDEISSQTVSFSVDGSTVVRRRNGEPASLVDLKDGALVNVMFSPKGSRDDKANSITLIAVPGDTFTFAGRVTFVDMHLGTFAVQNQTDNKRYDLKLDLNGGNYDDLQIGAQVRVLARFNGSEYVTQNIDFAQQARR